MTSETERTKKKLSILSDAWHGCKRCPLHETRVGDDIFFGTGNPTATYLIVLTSPTEADEASGGVLEGADGALLLGLLETAGIDTADCFITYAVSCRPKRFIPATEDTKERIETRTPVKEELTSCRPRLNEIIYRVDPGLIITIGEEALKTVVRGRLPKFLEVIAKQQVCNLFAADPGIVGTDEVVGFSRYYGLKYPVMPLPNMSAIVSNPSTAGHGPYNTALKALTRANEYIRFLEKQEKKDLR